MVFETDKLERERKIIIITRLNFRHGVVVPVADIGNRQSQLSLVIALSEEFVAHLQAPLAAHVPRPTRVRYVRALQRYLKYEVSQRRVLHVQLVVFQIVLQHCLPNRYGSFGLKTVERIFNGCFFFPQHRSVLTTADFNCCLCNIYRGTVKCVFVPSKSYR